MQLKTSREEEENKRGRLNIAIKEPSEGTEQAFVHSAAILQYAVASARSASAYVRGPERGRHATGGARKERGREVPAIMCAAYVHLR